MNFEKRVVIHRSGVPDCDKYCLVTLDDGTMERAFFDKKWIFVDEYLHDQGEVKAWCYIDSLFDAPKNVDIRMYIDGEESRI